MLTESGVVRSDITSSFGSASGVAEGVPLTLRFRVYDLAGEDVTPLAGAALYAWHCDREGNYSMYDGDAVDENYLRGVQEADEDGWLEFTTIFPACYAGRWPHVHFEIYESLDSATSASTKLRTSQLAFPQDVCDEVYATDGYEQSVDNLAQVSLDSDGIFSDGYSLQLAKVTGSVADGLRRHPQRPGLTGRPPLGGVCMPLRRTTRPLRRVAGRVPPARLVPPAAGPTCSEGRSPRSPPGHVRARCRRTSAPPPCGSHRRPRARPRDRRQTPLGVGEAEAPCRVAAPHLRVGIGSRCSRHIRVHVELGHRRAPRQRSRQHAPERLGPAQRPHAPDPVVEARGRRQSLLDHGGERARTPYAYRRS